MRTLFAHAALCGEHIEYNIIKYASCPAEIKLPGTNHNTAG
jgi:hypothetical protein